MPKPQTPVPAMADEALRIGERVVREALAARYQVAVVRAEQGELCVPHGRPLDIARAALAERGLDPDLVRGLDVAGLPWSCVPEEGVVLWRVPEPDAERVTELLAGDPPVQKIVEHDGWSLLQTMDGARGWASPGLQLSPCPAPGEDAELGGRSLGQLPIDAFVEAAESFVGAGYLWGGTGADGIDCSGLVQRSAWIAGRCWLPRHSTDLLSVGERVPRAQLRRGDLLILRHKEKGFHHVVVLTSADAVVHASLQDGRVMREPLQAIYDRYVVLGGRRLAGGTA